ncbi:MAG TPA: molybdopterin-dependent oxidoreductase [Gemmatimonadaceae bacterium]
MTQRPKTVVKRREFLKVLGSTGAAATAVGCSMERVEQLIPYVVSPDHTVPGVSTYYATVCHECTAACGVIAEVRDGRAIKLEGNPEHPVNRGALCARGQAALQGLYNPDRYRGPMIRRDNRLQPATWEEALARVRQGIDEARAANAAAGVRFVSQHENGSFGAFVDQWMAAGGFGAHVAYDAEADLAARAAHQAEYGTPWPAFDFTAARLIVSIGADFLDGWGASVPQQLSFADARAKLVDAPRFVYIGPRRSLTGLNADEWIACRPGSELAIANALLGAVSGDSSESIASAASAAGVPEPALQRVADELRAARPSLVLGGVSTPDAFLVAQAAARINQAAGNVGTTIKPAEGFAGMGGASGDEAMAALARDMNAGSVRILFIRGANPVHALPGSMQFAEGLARVGLKVSFSSYPDETSELCDVVLPDHHCLESWGDSEPVRGTLALQQPVMDPVFNTRATADVLLGMARADAAMSARFPWPTYREFLMARYPGGAQAFIAALARGIGQGSAMPRTVTPAPAAPVTAPRPIGGDGDFFLVVHPSPALGTGAGANKPWLQELPDPVSKICWQSWIELHPSAAARLGVHAGDHVTVTTAAGSITAPAWIYLGIHPESVAVSLGQGHTAYGRYAQGVGVNPVAALGATFDGGGRLAWTQTRARVEKAAGHSPLVTTEGSARQHGRGIARALTAAQLAAGETEDAHHEFIGDASHEFLPGLRSPVANDAQGALGDTLSNRKGMYDPDHWSGMASRRWAMTIDLARCTGCSACVTACYAENNIPTVGARWQGRSLRPFHSEDGAGWDTRPGSNILKGREMAWIRIERYFEGGEDGTQDFETRFVPMLCQHCGNAPCEPVCPVFATYHAPDGLNVQVYNRCVGTRYCSNGCPYKVRYFNWHGYGEVERRQYAFPEPLHLQLNPDVTVRGKGVMEKCTFCVQRIRDAENRATAEGRTVQPDEFTTACAQACPSRAIVFGDAASEEWTVAGQVDDPRAYHVFEELNTFTAVVYLKKVNHPGGPR